MVLGGRSAGEAELDDGERGGEHVCFAKVEMETQRSRRGRNKAKDKRLALVKAVQSGQSGQKRKVKAPTCPSDFLPLTTGDQPETLRH